MNESVTSAAMPQYQSHKRVWALQIGGMDGDIVLFQDLHFQPREFPPEVFSRGRPGVGDYMVQYEDGYWSWSPREPFEAGYDPVRGESRAGSVPLSYLTTPRRRPEALNAIRDEIHRANALVGWWTAKDGTHLLAEPERAGYVVGTKLMLSVSELAEAMEGHRKGLMDDHLPHRPMIEVELADALIRIMDLAGALARGHRRGRGGEAGL